MVAGQLEKAGDFIVPFFSALISFPLSACCASYHVRQLGARVDYPALESHCAVLFRTAFRCSFHSSPHQISQDVLQGVVPPAISVLL